MNAGQKLLAVKRIRRWPRHEREFLTRLTEREAEFIGQLVVELDIRPVEEGSDGAGPAVDSGE